MIQEWVAWAVGEALTERLDEEERRNLESSNRANRDGDEPILSEESDNDQGGLLGLTSAIAWNGSSERRSNHRSLFLPPTPQPLVPEPNTPAFFAPQTLWTLLSSVKLFRRMRSTEGTNRMGDRASPPPGLSLMFASCPEAAELIICMLDNPGPLLKSCRSFWTSFAKLPSLRAKWLLCRPKPDFLTDLTQAWPFLRAAAANEDEFPAFAALANQGGSNSDVGCGVWGLYFGLRARIVNHVVIESLSSILHQRTVSPNATGHPDCSDPFRLPKPTSFNPRLIYLLRRLRTFLVRDGDSDTCLFALSHNLLLPPVPAFIRSAWAASNREACFRILEYWVAQQQCGDSAMPSNGGGHTGSRHFLNSPDFQNWVTEDLLPADDVEAISHLSRLGLFSSWHFAVPTAVATHAVEILCFWLTNGFIDSSALLMVDGAVPQAMGNRIGVAVAEADGAGVGAGVERLVDGSNSKAVELLNRMVKAGLNPHVGGERLLREAARRGNEEMVIALLALGCNPSRRSLAADSALEDADRLNGVESAVEELGVELSALEIAEAHKQFHIVRLLGGGERANVFKWLESMYDMDWEP
ncbi:hypothetical protein DFJ73DRAFT_186765 [Zopfochytrium polystomum]|nr:hypothetical protein DFJ73DRAFT_186765 [Zopfochytrium polystomum]